MSKVTKKEVEHVAKLARLGLSEDEKNLFTQQLNNILEFAETLNKINTDKIEPTTHAIPMKNVLREDKAIPCENTKDIMKNAPSEEKGMFRVPKILE